MNSVVFLNEGEVFLLIGIGITFEGGIYVDRYSMCEMFIRDALNCERYAHNGIVDASNIERSELHRVKPIVAMAMYAAMQNITQEQNERAENLLYDLIQSNTRNEMLDIVERFRNEICTQ